MIEGLLQTGISDINVVVGYKKELFEELPKEYPGVKLIENPYYDCTNNISSMYVARDYLEDAIVLEGDQIIMNPEVLTPNFERTCYNAIWRDGEIGEWYAQVENDVMTQCNALGGTHGWEIHGVSRWTAEDGAKLKKHLEQMFAQEQYRQCYWDEVAMSRFKDEYQLGVMEMHDGDLVELDSLQELAAMDSSYQDLLAG